jgi:hypothetical protein
MMTESFMLWRRGYHPLQMTFRRQANLLGWIILLAGTAVLLGKILWGGQVLSASDILTYYYPVKTAVRNLFLQGESLLWNPMLGEGQPLAANPEHEIFYPFTWLLFVLPVRRALAISEAAHIAIGFWGAIQFLRKLRLSQAASLLGAASWTFGGLLMSSIHFFPVLYAWAWVPWLAQTALAQRFSYSAGLSGALFFGLILLSGEPVSALMAAAVFTATLFGSRVTASRLRLSVAIAVLGLGLGCAAWLPGARLAAKGTRGRGISDQWANLRSFPPQRLVELLLPRATGNTTALDDRLYLGWRFYEGRVWPFYWGLYGGLLLVPLAVAGLSRARRRPVLALAAAGALFFVLALGPPGLLWSSARRWLPPWRAIRYPEKFLAVTLFCLVAAMAAGFDVVRKSRRALRLVCAWTLLLGAALLLLGAFPASWQPLLQRKAHLWRNIPADFARAGVQSVLFGGALRYLAAALLLTLLLKAVHRSPSRKGLLALIPLAAAADVIVSSRDFFQSRPASWMDASPPVVKQLLAVRPPNRLVDHLPPFPTPSALVLHVQNGGYERARILDDQPVQWGVPLALDTDFDMTYIAPSVRAHDLMAKWGASDARVFSRLLAGRHAGSVLIWRQPFTLENPVTPLGIPGCRPEVDSELFVRTFHGDEDFFTVTRPNPDLLPRTALLETPAPADLPSSPAEARIANLRMRSASLEFDASAPAPALIRIARTNDGNWKAALDGKPWPLHTADISLIGLSLPPGTHHVSVEYRDGLLALSGLISALSLIALTLCWWRCARSRPR